MAKKAVSKKTKTKKVKSDVSKTSPSVKAPSAPVRKQVGVLSNPVIVLIVIGKINAMMIIPIPIATNGVHRKLLISPCVRCTL